MRALIRVIGKRTPAEICSASASYKDNAASVSVVLYPY